MSGESLYLGNSSLIAHHSLLITHFILVSHMIPQDFTLETSRVLLRPIIEPDYDDFLIIAQDDDTWQYFSLNLSDPVQLKQWMNSAFNEKEINTRRPFTIIEKSSGRIAGSTSFGNISINDMRIEIGWSWMGKEFRSTELNSHAKYALMKYAFEVLRFERVEFKTDVLNSRARRGLEKVGALQEGVLRSHMKMWNNRRRDSVFYSVLKEEWKQLKQTIFKGFDDEGR